MPKNNKVIGIVGSRTRNSDKDFFVVKAKFLELYKPGDIICSGLCPTGADKFAYDLSILYNTRVQWFPALWNKYGRGAGFVRNGYIARASDFLIACVSEDRTGGTEDTITKFLKFNLKKNLFIV